MDILHLTMAQSRVCWVSNLGLNLEIILGRLEPLELWNSYFICLNFSIINWCLNQFTLQTILSGLWRRQNLHNLLVRLQSSSLSLSSSPLPVIWQSFPIAFQEAIEDFDKVKLLGHSHTQLCRSSKQAQKQTFSTLKLRQNHKSGKSVA